jgi:hypothetical protein
LNAGISCIRFSQNKSRGAAERKRQKFSRVAAELLSCPPRRHELIRLGYVEDAGYRFVDCKQGGIGSGVDVQGHRARGRIETCSGTVKLAVTQDDAGEWRRSQGLLFQRNHNGYGDAGIGIERIRRIGPGYALRNKAPAAGRNCRSHEVACSFIANAGLPIAPEAPARKTRQPKLTVPQW